MTIRRRSLAALLCSAALLAAPGARADDAKKDASQRFRSGVSFYHDKDYAAAMVEFKKAYELAPNYNVLFNIGQTSRELKDYAAALKAFEQYLRDGGTKVAAGRQKEVQAAIDDLRKKVGKLKLVLNVDGAQIAVDDAVVGTSPLAEPVLVNVGRRKLSATSAGYEPLQRVVDVAGGDETNVSLELLKLTASGPPLPPPPPPKQGLPVVTLVTLSATGVSLVVTTILGGLAVSAHKSLESDLGQFPGNPTTIAADQSRTKTLANATDAFIGITVMGAATSAVLLVLPRFSEKAKATIGISPFTMGGGPPYPPARPVGVAISGAF